MSLVLVLVTVRSVYIADSTYGPVEMDIAKLGITRLGLVIVHLFARHHALELTTLSRFVSLVRSAARISGISRSASRRHLPEFSWSGLPRRRWK